MEQVAADEGGRGGALARSLRRATRVEKGVVAMPIPEDPFPPPPDPPPPALPPLPPTPEAREVDIGALHAGRVHLPRTPTPGQTVGRARGIPGSPRQKKVSEYF